MNYFSLIRAGLKHYFKSHLLVFVGVAISTAVLTGALIVGDSVIYSLQQSTRYRLGGITHTFTGGDRFFQQDLAARMGVKYTKQVSAVLKMEGIASAEGGLKRLSDIQIWGVDSVFNDVTGTTALYDSLQDSEVLISSNMAARLDVKAGDRFSLRIGKSGLIPSNAPFVSEEEQTVSVRVIVKAIVATKEMGRLNLRTSQTAPFNLFMAYSTLAKLTNLATKANMLLIAAKEQSSQTLLDDIENIWTMSDAGMELRYLKDLKEWSITSERVFIEQEVTQNLTSAMDGLQARLCYFVNDFKTADKTTPYSFVSGINQDLNNRSIIINQWLADDLNLGVGDSVALSYFSMGPLRSLREKQTPFKVVKVVPITGVYADRFLMPNLPGLSDAGNCRDWDTGVPIALDAIRAKDEAYWEMHKGTPKAFISQEMADSLWSNRFGNTTVLRLADDKISQEDLSLLISKHVSPKLLGYKVNAVLEQGMFAANNGTDFGQLFIGLSFFIIFSGLLLTSMLFLLGIEQRSAQIGTFVALGLKKRIIHRLFFAEAMVITLLGATLGLILAIAYNTLIFQALNRLWNDIVRTSVLEVSVQLDTLLTGFVASVLIASITIWWSLKRSMKKTATQQQKALGSASNKHFLFLKKVVVVIFVLSATSMVFFDFLSNQNRNPSVFFMAGGLLLIAFLLYVHLRMQWSTQQKYDRFTWKILAGKNRALNSTRSLTQIALLAIGTYLVISTGANRKDLFASAHLKSSGTGGFNYVAEATVPVLIDMNNPEWRLKEGIENPFYVLSFRATEGDDASCLNLNRISNPRILGVDPELLEGRFSFVSWLDEFSEMAPWQVLNTDHSKVIPAIADQTVIQWGLGKKVGDTLQYQNARGEALLLRLVGGLAGSVFQGNVLISEAAFLRHFPSSSGATFFLIEATPENAQMVENELNSVFRDDGWEMTNAAQRLAEYKTIENTYLSIFLVLGGLGLLVGAFGFIVVLQRSLLQRRSEIATYLTQGLSRSFIGKIIRKEVMAIFVSGIGIGTLTALISISPMLQTNTSDTIWLIVQMLGGLLLFAYLSVRWMVARSISQHRLIEALRDE